MSEDTHARSDVDIAVEFEDVRPTDQNYNDVFFALSDDLGEVFGTTDVDLVDFRTVTAELAEVIFDQGVLIVGEPERVADLRTQRTKGSSEQSPRDRLDAALSRIDDHLSGSAVTETNDERPILSIRSN